MDERRFDQFTRVMAARDSRRKLLRGLAGGVGLVAVGHRVGTVAARHGVAGPGNPCRTSAQCIAADAPLVCDDNGFSYDGPLNCCTYVGSRCGSDEACCGSAVCAGGYCAAQPTYSGPGDPCQNGSQCLAADTAVYCDYVASTDDYRCCALQGDRCGSDAGCCGWLTCEGGRCQ